ncbi:ABC transporter permease [Streptomyces scopuliridis]|uniref:ABC transporter permease n=1 Tax=Streptomyces scopuliridis TaxID=452529 RepID=UPI0036CF2CE3
MRTERWIGVSLILVIALACVVVPVLDPVSPTVVGTPMQPPSAAHLLGTDQLGRDIFVRLFYAGRIDLVLTTVSVLAASCVGTTVGLVVSALPKTLRGIALRLIDALNAIPYLVLVLGIVAGVGTKQVILGAPAGAVAVVIALVIAGWAPYATLTLSQALLWRERESVIAARLMGYSYPRILLRHIGPAMLPANISYAATHAVSTMSALAALALLGVGVQEPTPELGQMMQQGIALLPVAWWVSIIPGLAILTLGIGFGLISDSFDARTKR